MKFLIADDHHLIREGLRYALECAYDGLSVIEATDGEQVLEAVANNPELDLILLDFFMPRTDGIALVSTLCERYPRIPIVIISGADDPVLMHKTLERGVAGFISKSTDHNMILQALELVLSGGIYIPPDFKSYSDSSLPAGYGLPPLPENPESSHKAPPRKYPPAVSKADLIIMKLTQRQQEVLRLMAKGKTNKDISRDLCVSENTVKVHVTAILKALGVSNRTQAVLMAQKLGLF